MFINSIVKTNAPLPEQDAYLRKIPAISGLSRLDLNCPVTFLVGENGSGKSTLLEAVAVAFGFNPEGGSRNFHFSTEDTHSALSQLLCLYKGPYRPKDGFFLRAESFYNAAKRGGQTVKKQPLWQQSGQKLPAEFWREVAAPAIPWRKFPGPGAQPLLGKWPVSSG